MILRRKNELCLKSFDMGPQPFLQSELNYSVRGLDISKNSAKLKSTVDDFTRKFMMLKHAIKENAMWYVSWLLLNDQAEKWKVESESGFDGASGKSKNISQGKRVNAEC